MSLSRCYIEVWKLKHITDQMLKKAKEQKKCTILKALRAKLVRTKKRHMKIIIMNTTKQPRENGCVRLAFSNCWSYLPDKHTKATLEGVTGTSL